MSNLLMFIHSYPPNAHTYPISTNYTEESRKDDVYDNQ